MIVGGKYGEMIMGRYILMVMLCVIMGCASNPDVKDNAKQDKNIKKDLLYYFWVVTGGM